MDLPSANFHLAGSILKNALMFLTETFDNFLIHSLLMMTQLAVIHMEANHCLTAFDHLVGYARIIWVEFETNVCQTLDKFVIVK